MKNLSYLLRHKWWVCWALLRLAPRYWWRALTHDLSKLRPGEFRAYSRYFYGDGDQSVFDRAWLTHVHRNPHHWQYWILREDDGGAVCLPMPECYAAEMVADWIGAGKALGKDNEHVYRWYARQRELIQLHPDTRMLVENYIARWRP